jgi:hypothetical protein
MSKLRPIAHSGAARRGAIVRFGATATALLICSLLFAASSDAGTYRVDSCRVPSGPSAGESAPLEFSEGAIEVPGEWNRISSGDAMYADTCESDGSLMAGLEAGIAHGNADAMTWQFTAPTGESIQKATLWRAGDADGGAGYEYWLASPVNTTFAEPVSTEYFAEACAYQLGCEKGAGTGREPLASENELEIPQEDLGSHLYINVACARAKCAAGAGDEDGRAVVVNLYAAEMEFEETEAPTVSDVSGELATASTLSGEANLAFTAEDEGSGVYEEIVEVDGKLLQKSVIDGDAGRCAALGTGSEAPLTFLYPTPCPRSVEGHVAVDTSELADGEHALKITVTDAAGNATPVLEREVDVENHASGTEGEGGEGSGKEGSGKEGSAGEGDKESSGKEASGKESTGERAEPGEEEGGDGSEAPDGPGASSNGSQTPPADGAPPGAAATAGPLSESLPAPQQDLDPIGAPNGSPASDAANLSVHWVGGEGTHSSGGGKLLRTPFGHAAKISGTLRSPAGAPIAGALVTIDATPAYGGAGPVAMKSLRTGRQGRIAIELPRDASSRTIELSYASALGGERSATATLRLRVAAGVKLAVKPKRTDAGGTIRLSGKVLGSPIPHGGKEVVLEARSRGTRWLQFDVLRTNRHGSFEAAHRFRLPGPIRYSFRAVCPGEADFPFDAGSSRDVEVSER